MKTPYSAVSLHRILTRLYPSDRFEPGMGAARVLRTAAFDAFTGALVATPYERDVILSACLDIKANGYLTYAADDAATAYAEGYRVDPAHDERTHLHLTRMAEMLWSRMMEEDDYLPSNGIYTVSRADTDSIVLEKQVSRRAGRNGPPQGEAGPRVFVAEFDREHERLVRAHIVAADLVTIVAIASRDSMDAVNEWANGRNTRPRIAA